jgi:hypothetical protein
MTLRITRPACLLTFVLVLVASQAESHADITNVTLYPNFAGADGVAGNTSTSATGFSSSSWQESSSSKGEVYIPASSLFASPVKIADIASITYWTDKGTTAADPDWSLYLYTALQSSGNSASWYHSRLTAEPYFTNTPSVAPNTWHQWSTGGSDPLRFYDSNRDGGVFGTYTDPTLAALQSSTVPVNWPTSNTSVNYSQEVVNLFSLQTGSAWSSGFNGLVDGLTITLFNGDVANVNLEAVPEPASLFVWSLLGLSIGTVYRKRKHDRCR